MIRDLMDVPEGVNLEIKWVGPDVLTFDLDVHPAYRNQGLARAVMEDFVEAADELGCHVALMANPSDPDMKLRDLMRFYRSLGFIPIGYHGYMYRPTEVH